MRERTADEMKMMALSVKQPWADLIVEGVKDIENRTWPTNRRGPLLIHASRQWDDSDYAHLFGEKKDFVFGALIGIVDLVDCVTHSYSDWFEGPYGLVLENAKKFIEPFFCKGRLRFFVPDIPKGTIFKYEP